MANGIKIGNLDISAFKVGSSDCKVYLGDTLLYPTTPPAFNGKWLATYDGGTTSSAECDASSAITENDFYDYNTDEFVSVEIGDCVTSIGDYAFGYCTSLTSIDIPDSVTSIGQGVFTNCTSLTSCTIGSGVTSIGNSVFFLCTSLTSITVNATTPPTIYVNTLDDTNNCPIYVPSASVNAYKSATNWRDYASRIQAIPTPGITTIPYGADMTQYYNQPFSRFVINDTSLPSGYSQISLGFNTGGIGIINSGTTNFTIGSTHVSSLPCDVTDTGIITSWTTYDSSWQATNLNPFQDLQIEFI